MYFFFWQGVTSIPRMNESTADKQRVDGTYDNLAVEQNDTPM